MNVLKNRVRESLHRLPMLEQVRAGWAALCQFRLGIASHLLIGLVAVALLAVAANLFALEGESIIRTVHILSSQVQASRHPPIANQSDATEIRTISPGRLIAAIERYDRAIQARIDSPGADADARLSAEKKEIDKAAKRFTVEAKEVLGIVPSGLATAVKNYFAAGANLVEASDARRAALRDFSACLEAMNGRLKASVGKAWKIFGRVLARQSLLDLSASLDAVRRDAAALSMAESIDADRMRALHESEAAFSALFDQNEKSLARAYGRDWVAQMRGDYQRLSDFQEQLIRLQQQRDTIQQHLGQNRALLASLVSADTQARLVRSRRQASDAAKAASANAIPENTAPQEMIQVSTVPAATSHRVLVAWLSAGVLMLLILISTMVIRSIVIPVQTLMKATKRIASGARPLPIPRGGIKELDHLGMAFNQMAEQLAAAQEAARNHQLELETAVRERTHQLQELAEHDPLTRLPNRRQFFGLFNSALDTASAGGRIAGLFFVDIDNFKNINDGLGHAVGDSVLVAIARRLERAAQSFGFAARLGGDEFTVVYENCTSVDVLRAAGEAIVHAFSEPLLVDGRYLHVSVSVGASIYPLHERDPHALLRAADAALFRAKALGRSQLNMFTPELVQIAADKFAIEQGLRRALDHGEFQLVFQPELCLETLEVELVEALIRWQLPDGRLASPGEFLAVAEESGLILDISQWVLRSAIEAASSWHHGVWPNVRVAINIAARHLLEARFVEKLQVLLREHELPPRCIELELTETVLQTAPATIAVLKKLHTLGISIALDDFGTGYSSLASLESLPLTRIKLDRSLIAGIDSNPRSAAIARAIIELSQALGLKVTAEGIERPEQFVRLLGHRSMSLQGYLLARPVLRTELMTANARAAQLAREWVLNASPEPISPKIIELSDARLRKL